MKTWLVKFITFTLLATSYCAGSLRPQISGDWWVIATDPDLGDLTSPAQQPVDFGIWQAADGTWQLWSCIRGTKEKGKTRLFHRWEGRSLTNSHWEPKGIVLRADTQLGETPGGLQAPFVVRDGKRFCMFYGDMENICLATSEDGKNFVRQTNSAGRTGMFSEGAGNNTRDPMAININGLWHCYYTAYPNLHGADFCRTSKDLVHWSEAEKVALGGQAGTGLFSAECPFVVQPQRGEFFLFRTQRYGEKARTSVYHSRDPLKFGIDQDEKYLVTTLPLAAPEIILLNGQYYIAALLPSLKGIQMARLKWISE